MKPFQMKMGKWADRAETVGANASVVWGTNARRELGEGEGGEWWGGGGPGGQAK